tara:strand:- start:955 stop:1248 length:294 start_codon:yes stop_codon:yes gene_type:complete
MKNIKYKKGDLVLFFDPTDRYKKYPAVVQEVRRTCADIMVYVDMFKWETWEVHIADMKHTKSFRVASNKSRSNYIDKGLWIVPPCVVWKKDEQRRKQ